MATPEFESPSHSQAEARQQAEGVEPQQPNLRLLQGGAEQRSVAQEPYTVHHMGEIAMVKLVAMKEEQDERMKRWAEYLKRKPYVEGEENIAARPLNLMDNGKPVDRQENDAHV